MNLSKFTNKLEKNCQARQLNILLPEGEDQRILQTCQHLLEADSTASILIFGDSATFHKNATMLGVNLSVNFRTKQTRLRFVDEIVPDLADQTARHLEASYRKRGRPLEEAKLLALSRDRLFQSAYLVERGYAHACVAGAVAPTADVIRAGLGVIGLAPQVSSVSGAFVMVRDDDQSQFVFTDCGVVVEPTSEQLAASASAAVALWQGLEKARVPQVCFLSFSTKGSAKHPAVDKVSQAVELFRKAHPDINVDGEFQFDAAFDEGVRKRKAPNSPLRGRPDIFVFPDLQSGNIAYKITQRLGGFQAYGPILLGLAKPFSDLSRGATVEDIIASVYINLLSSPAGVSAQPPSPAGD